jgi:CRISPR-associated endonuclease/helicase Cas3
MSDCPSFSEFYQSVHHREPFPWQRRLAEQVVASGWPEEIGVPTGLGKTSAIDIAIWSLAAQSHLDPRERTAPTRIWYVVNRRLLVDAASEHASRLAALLAAPTDDVVSEIARRLQAIEGGLTGQPLRSSRMRGGGMLDSRPRHLGQPAILCATVPMFASRLLFRAYGSSNRVWPIDAALAGVDSLVLLDEAHLSPALRDLVGVLPDADACRSGVLRALGAFTAGPGPSSLVGSTRSYPRLVSLTATGGHECDRFDLDEADLTHPVVQRRLASAKQGEVRTASMSTLAASLAEATLEHLRAVSEPTSVLVFVNRPVEARRVAAELERQFRLGGHGDVELVVLTGQVRGIDADAIRARLLDPVAGIPSGSSRSLPRSLVVIATQTLEVGADLDSAHLVTESAGVRALVQRIGRLNRLGERDHAAAIIVHPADRDGGLYGKEPAEVVARLSANPSPLDFSPRAIASVLGEPTDTPGRHAELLPAHLWEWSKTSVRTVDSPPIELFYEGFGEPDRTVAVAWRAHLADVGEPLYPGVDQSEWVDVPINEARDFVVAHGDRVRALSIDGATLVAVDAEMLRPGMRLTAHTSTGWYSATGWDPGSAHEVADVSWRVCGTVALLGRTLEHVLGPMFDDELRAALGRLDEEDIDREEESAIAALVAERIAEALRATDGKAVALTRPMIDRVGADNAPFLRWGASSTRPEAPTDSLDELSLAPRADLADHLAHVGDLARRIAMALGLPDDIVRAVGEAGAFHDIGKADPRFQSWLGAVDPAQPLAKSAASPGRWQKQRLAAGWPAGARHELLSVQLLDAASADGLQLADESLVRHLVIAHHGHGRPSVDVAAEGASPALTSVKLGTLQVSAETDPGAADWEQPNRFRDLSETYGIWGLAMLETIVRQADHIISEITEVQ